MAAALAEALQQLSCGAGSGHEGEEGAEHVWVEADAGCSAAPGGDGHAAAGPVNAKRAYGPQEGWLLCASLAPYFILFTIARKWFRVVRA